MRKLQLGKHQLPRVEGTHPQPRCWEHPHNSKPVEKLRFKKPRPKANQKNTVSMPSRAVKPNQKGLPADVPSCPGAASTSPAPSQPTNDSPLQKHRPHNLQLRGKRAEPNNLPTLSRTTWGAPHPSRYVAGRAGGTPERTCSSTPETSTP